MADHIHTHSAHVRGAAGTEYEAHVYGLARSDGTWQGWLEFVPVKGGVTLRTGQETSQPSRDAVAYWAGGLEPVYLDGALSRAWP